MAEGLTDRLDPAIGALRTALAERSIRRLIVAWAASNAGQYALLVLGHREFATLMDDQPQIRENVLRSVAMWISEIAPGKTN